MTETLTIINTFTLLILLIVYLLARKRYGANAFMHPRAGDKLSMLNRRRKALRLATNDWHRTVESGYTSLTGNCKRLVDQLEREVAALENELFGTAEEVTPKVETPKRQPVAKVEFVGDEFFPDCYIITCSFCGWSWWGRSAQTAVEKSVEHEMRHV